MKQMQKLHTSSHCLYQPNCQRFNRRRGFVTLYLALSLIVLLGISSLVVDLGIAYQKRASMQKAADASALAGAAYGVQNPTASATAIQTAATTFASTNYGYSNNVDNATVTASVTKVTDGNGSIIVGIARPQPTLFARIFRMSLFKSGTSLTINATNIGARATALFTTTGYAVGGISGNNNSYGLNSTATANLSLVGPLASTNRGDNRSSYYTSSDGTNTGIMSPNTGKPDQDTNYAALDMKIRRPEDDRFNDSPSQLASGEAIPKGDGYYFDLSIPANTPVALQLYDPGNANENTDPSTLFNKKWNETTTGTNSTRGPGPNGTMRTVTTKTRFQVWCDMGHPEDITQAKRIFSNLYADEPQYSFDNSANSAYKGWINAVNIDPNAVVNGVRLYPVGAKFYMNATTVDGNGKNGFNVRLNRLDPQTSLPKDTDANYSAAGGNGTSVTTRGLLPINFGSNGTATLSLGDVPANATSVTIKRFDVDVGTSPGGFAVTYTDTNSGTHTGGFGYGGYNANDKTQTDVFNLGAGYTGGNWTASYSAGTSDQSTWTMSYVGPPQFPITNIRLTD